MMQEAQEREARAQRQAEGRRAGLSSAGEAEALRTAMWYGALGLLVAVPVLFIPSLPDLKSVVTEAATVGLLAPFLAWRHRAGWRASGRMILLPPLLALLAASLLSLGSAVDGFEGLRGAYRLAMAILLLAMLREIVRGRAEAEVATHVLVGVGALVGLIAILQVLGFEVLLPQPTRAAPIGTLGNTNYLGGYLATLLPVSLGVAVFGDRRPVRLSHAAASVPMLVALALTRARGAWFGFGFGLAVLLLVLARRWGPESRKGAWTCWTVLLGTPILGFIVAETLGRPLGLPVLERLSSVVALSDRGVTDRLEWWGQGLQLALGHPLLGTGISNFPIAVVPYLRHVEATLNRAFWVEHTHNEFLSVAYETGALGLLAALWLILRGWRLIRPCLDWGRGQDFLRPAVAAGLVGAMGDSVFFYLFHDPTGLVIVLALLAILERLTPGERSRPGAVGDRPPDDSPASLSSQQASMNLAAPVAARTGGSGSRTGPGLAAAWVICAGVFVTLGLRPAVSAWLVHQARATPTRQEGARAVDLLQRAVAWNGRNVTAHFALGTALLATGRINDGMGSLREALRLNPLFISARSNLAYGHVLLKRPAEGRREYRQLIALAPHFAAAHNNLGYLSLQAGDFRTARAELRRALDLFPGQSDARYNLGRIALAEGDSREAIRELEEALRLAPGMAQAWLELAKAQAAAGTTEPALASLGKAVALNPALRQEARADARLARLWGQRAFEEMGGPR